MIDLLFDTRWIGPSGNGRIARELSTRLENRVKLNSIGSFPLLHPLEPLWLSWQIASQQPQFFFSPGFNPPLISTSPFAFAICDLIHLRFPDIYGLKQRAYYEGLVKPAAKRAKFVMTISEFSRQEILNWTNLPPDRVRLIYLGAGEEYTPDGERYTAQEPYILHVGNHKPHKNLPRLLQAYALSGVTADYLLLLTGNRSVEISSLVNSLGLEQRVRFLGIVPENQLPAIYRGAALLVQPSLYEGFGIPPLEAMACGTPVAVSNVTSLPEVTGDSAILFNPYDVDAIANALKTILSNDTLREELRLKGVQQAKRFSWEKATAELLDDITRAITQN